MDELHKNPGKVVVSTRHAHYSIFTSDRSYMQVSLTWLAEALLSRDTRFPSTTTFKLSGGVPNTARYFSVDHKFREEQLKCGFGPCKA